MITGYFWTSKPITGTGKNAGTVEVEIGNAPDGYGTATIRPNSVKAGSNDKKIIVEYTVPGTMDGGVVRLSIPNGWGSLQEDPTERNYLEVDVTGSGSAAANIGPSAVEATLDGVVKGDKVKFIYGGGTVRSLNGAEVQSSITDSDDPAPFVIETDGDGDGIFVRVNGEQREKEDRDDDDEAERKPLGKIYRHQPGLLYVEVTGADDGSGSAEVAIVNTGQSEAMYPDDQDIDGDRDTEELVDSYRIHARRYRDLSEVHLHTDGDHPKRATDIQKPSRMESTAK